MTGHEAADPYEAVRRALAAGDSAATADAIRALHRARRYAENMPDAAGGAPGEGRRARPVPGALVIDRELEYRASGAFLGGADAVREAVCRVVHDNARGIAWRALDARKWRRGGREVYYGVCDRLNLSIHMPDDVPRVDTYLTDGVRVAVRFEPRPAPDLPLGFVVESACPMDAMGARYYPVAGVPESVIDRLLMR